MQIIYSKRHLFSIVRILLGIYMCIYFCAQYKEFDVLFVNFFHPTLEKIFFSKFFIGVGFLASLLFTFGIIRRLSAPFILLACLFLLQQNQFLYEVHFGYIGWMLLCFMILAEGEPYSLYPKSVHSWRYPKIFHYLCLLSLGSSYTASGLAKHIFDGWNSGEAIKFFFHAGMSRPYVRILSENFNQEFYIFMTYFVGLIEVITLPMLFYKKTRPYIWLILTAGQLQMIFISKIYNVSIAMFIFHIFCFNPAWIKWVKLDFKKKFYNYS